MRLMLAYLFLALPFSRTQAVLRHDLLRVVE